MSIHVENPPDLIVAVPSDDHNPEKKKLLIEDTPSSSPNEKNSDSLSLLKLENKILQCEIQRLRNQQTPNLNDDYDEQSSLLQHRFYEEIQSILTQQEFLGEQITEKIEVYVKDVVRKSIDSIQSLRLLHQKELCTLSKDIHICIQQQTTEMNELCQYLIEQQHSVPLIRPLIDNCRSSLDSLKRSFDTKIDYLYDIHSSVVSSLKNKHNVEVNEMKCELSLLSQHR